MQQADPDAMHVLILYTGGTIGMKRTARGYAPVSGWLEPALHRLSQLQDPDQPPGTMPLSAFGRRITYDVLECDPLLDSSNMGPQDWVRLAEIIGENYDSYDAFVILHGTDTMAWTAAALSFMLVNLSKTVILTGSQIPLVEVRSDALDNLLGALTVAGHYEIPEVCLFFHEQLMRGNRTRKSDNVGLAAFSSDNLPPLARLGIQIDVAWHLIRPTSEAPLRIRPITERNVATLRLFPGIPASVARNVLAPPLRGLVLETFGSGNAPDNRPDLLAAFREATDRGVVIVNVTQCPRGSVRTDYAAGTALAEAGIIPGADMTTEAALTKLAYLLSLDLPHADVRKLVSTDIRGELSRQERRRFSFRERTFVDSVTQVLTRGAVLGSDPEVERALFPVLLCAAGQRGDTAALVRMAEDGINLSAADYDGRTALHLAAAEGHTAAVRYLLQQGADANAVDRWGRTPIEDALQREHGTVAALLADRGGRRRAGSVAAAMCAAASAGSVDELSRLLDNGADPNLGDYDKRTALHLAAAEGHAAAVELLLSHGADPSRRDRWGATAAQEALRYGHGAIAKRLGHTP